MNIKIKINEVDKRLTSPDHEKSVMLLTGAPTDLLDPKNVTLLTGDPK